MLVKDKYFLEENEKKSIWNIIESDIFKSARIENFIDRESKKVHRLVYVEEKKRGLFEISIGYSTFEKFKVSGGVLLRNLFGIGLNSRLNYSRSQLFEEYSLSLRDNFFFSRWIFTEGKIFKSFENHESFNLFSDGLSYLLGLRLDKRSALGVSFTYFNAKTEGVEVFKGHGKKLGAFLRIPFTELRFTATEGTKDYLKFEVLNKFRKEIVKDKYGVGFKANFGSVSKSAPIFDRFFLGGYLNMKGYSYESIGKPFGGRYYAYLNGEVFYILKRKYELSTYLEFGNVRNKISEVFKNMKSDIVFSAGLRTPVGVVKGELAYPLDEKKFSLRKFKIYLSVEATF